MADLAVIDGFFVSLYTDERPYADRVTGEPKVFRENTLSVMRDSGEVVLIGVPTEMCGWLKDVRRGERIVVEAEYRARVIPEWRSAEVVKTFRRIAQRAESNGAHPSEVTA
jgi:hypothetical protein